MTKIKYGIESKTKWMKNHRGGGGAKEGWARPSVANTSLMRKLTKKITQCIA